MSDFDAILLVSFGGPENDEEVMPFLEHVVEGRGVPRERLLSVAEHYYKLGGSPINGQNRDLIGALRDELEEHAEGRPIYFGNRHSAPFLKDTLAQMAKDGVKSAAAILTSAFSSYSGCRQYREAVLAAQEAISDAPKVRYVRRFFNHPGFIDAMVDRIGEALDQLGADGARIAFTAHSIPVSMADGCDYVEQLMDVSEVIAGRVGVSQWQLVYQSRSGPPQVPWLEPDILDHIEALRQIGTEKLVVAPIGFVSDHMEVVWDLDHEAKDACEAAGIAMVRAGTVGTHPTFVAGLRELLQELRDDSPNKRALGTLGPRVNPCAQGCCPRPKRRPRPAGAGGRPPRAPNQDG